MKNTLLLISILSTTMIASLAHGKNYNPFMKPEVAKPIQTTSLSLPNDIHEAVTNKNTNQSTLINKSDAYLDKGFIYKGTINGIDIFFNPNTGRYIQDKTFLSDL
jgi:hypothetical protein